MSKTCRLCGNEFSPVRGGPIQFCSDACRIEKKREIARQWWQRCGLEYRRRRNEARKTQRSQKPKISVQRQCVICSRWFDPPTPSNKTCSKECRDKRYYKRKYERQMERFKDDPEFKNRYRKHQAKWKRESAACAKWRLRNREHLREYYRQWREKHRDDPKYRARVQEKFREQKERYLNDRAHWLQVRRRHNERNRRIRLITRAMIESGLVENTKKNIKLSANARARQSRAYREKLRNDPKKYSEYRAHKAEYSKKNRARAAEREMMMRRTPEYRERNAKYRQRVFDIARAAIAAGLVDPEFLTKDLPTTRGEKL